MGPTWVGPQKNDVIWGRPLKSLSTSHEFLSYILILRVTNIRIMVSSSCGLDECVDAFGYPGRWLFLTMVLTGFFCWALLEIMERQLGMAPKIVTVDQILEHARTDRDNPVGNFIVNRRLTKTYFGGYRMQFGSESNADARYHLLHSLHLVGRSLLRR